MELDSDNEPLRKIASGDQVVAESWPGLRNDILARLDKIAHGAFPIPNLPPPAPRPRLLSPVSSSPLEHSSQEANKENAPAETAAAPERDELPGQIAGQLSGIKAKLETFTADAPHTIQRLAELVLQPRAHYRALATYLHAVDRVVQVTSGTGMYPLPPAVPDMSAMNGGGGGGSGDEARDLAATVTWSNPTTASLGSDEALGGALLTPIPWLTRRSPESNGDGAGAQIHSEGTETIEGPNGVGSIETVSVSVNGVPSTGHARGVTQGELLRQEQRAGVVPVSQLSRSQEAPGDEDRSMDDEGGGSGSGGGGSNDEESETPHARGPEEIGVDDTGLQGVSTSYFSEDGVQMQDIDVEAAVGRRHDEVPHPAPAPADGEDVAGQDAGPEADAVVGAGGSRAKREADQGLEAEAPKKAKESDGAHGEAETGGSPAAAEATDAAEAECGDGEAGAGAVAAPADVDDAADAMEET
ncbi:PPP4R2 domain-containing protein [Hirsutella rhossiliensis]|uniref:PPP4R2 domain-containing protein n=1 Tax=Hirsutella rhossiliensis TaxID=111463 RepID=A0A9P8MWL8_9HYPO|nr:PPP4R2 domain-containing protein [Hirsutella rhossiliensis]KAH0962377.1 PPP4R2 domain-containing protein [Hirsutella rhossiliensis]